MFKRTLHHSPGDLIIYLSQVMLVCSNSWSARYRNEQADLTVVDLRSGDVKHLHLYDTSESYAKPLSETKSLLKISKSLPL